MVVGEFVGEGEGVGEAEGCVGLVGVACGVEEGNGSCDGAVEGEGVGGVGVGVKWGVGLGACVGCGV